MTMQKEKFSAGRATLDGFKRTFDYKGVTNREQYWAFFAFGTLITGLAQVVLAVPMYFLVQYVLLDSLLPRLGPFEAVYHTFSLIFLLCAIFVWFPLVSALVRRMRDAGFGGRWLAFAWVLPFSFIIATLPTATTNIGGAEEKKSLRGLGISNGFKKALDFKGVTSSEEYGYFFTAATCGILASLAAYALPTSLFWGIGDATLPPSMFWPWLIWNSLFLIMFLQCAFVFVVALVSASVRRMRDARGTRKA